MKFRKAFYGIATGAMKLLRITSETKALKSREEHTEITHEKNIRDVSASFMRASQIDLSDFDYSTILGGMIKMRHQLNDHEYAAECHDLGEKHEQALDEAYEAISNLDERLFAQRPHATRVFTDSEKCHPQNIIVIFPENPLNEDEFPDCSYDEARFFINEIFEPLGLYCVQCATSELPFCIMIGIAIPKDIEEYITIWSGQIIRNNTSYFCDPLNLFSTDEA